MLPLVKHFNVLVPNASPVYEDENTGSNSMCVLPCSLSRFEFNYLRYDIRHFIFTENILTKVQTRVTSRPCGLRGLQFSPMQEKPAGFLESCFPFEVLSLSNKVD